MQFYSDCEIIGCADSKMDQKFHGHMLHLHKCWPPTLITRIGTQLWLLEFKLEVQILEFPYFPLVTRFEIEKC